MNLLPARYAKTIAAIISYAIAFVVQQESLPHPFTGSWWVGLLTGAGVVLGVFGVPNAQPSPPAPAAPVPAPPVPAPLATLAATTMPPPRPNVTVVPPQPGAGL